MLGLKSQISPDFLETDIDHEKIDVDPVSLVLNEDYGDSFEDVREKAESFGSKLKNDMPFFGSRPYDPVSGNAGKKIPHGERVSRCYRCMVDDVEKVRVEGGEDWDVQKSKRPKFSGPNEIGYSCGNYSKICPHHARLEVSRLIEKYLPVLSEHIPDNHLYYICISPPNVPQGHLEIGREKNWNIWNRLRRRKYLDDRVHGALASEEFVTNKETGSWNHHINLIVASDFLDWSRINEDYREIVLDEYADEKPDLEKPSMPEIKKISEPMSQHDFSNSESRQTAYIAKLEQIKKSLQETIKYSAKFDSGDGGAGMLDWSPFQLREYIKAVWGQRTTRTYGDWYGLDDEDPEPPETIPLASVYSSWDRNEGRYIMDLIQVHNSTTIDEIATALGMSAEVLAASLKERDPPDVTEQEYNWNRPELIPDEIDGGVECA